MAQVVKNNNEYKYKLEDVTKKNKKVEKIKTEKKKKNVSEKNNKSLWDRFMIFCHGVKEEFKKVHWTSKEKSIKYSISTICFVLFLSIFFYLINIIFAAIQALFA